MEIDQIFVGIHVRCARLVSSLVPRPVRSLLQAASLLLSLFLLASLIWLHHQHIHPQGTHYTLTPRLHDPLFDASNSSTSGGFPSLVDWMRDSDVLRVCIEPPSTHYDVWHARHWSAWWSDRDRVTVVRHSYEHSDVASMGAEEDKDGAAAGVVQIAAEVAAHPSQQASAFTLRHVNRPPNFSSSPALPSSHTRSSTASLATAASHVYEYAHHKGYFLLPVSQYARHRVVTTTVTLPASHRAFGPFPLSFFTYHVYGYDSIVLNHLIRQMRLGFMRNANTNDIYTLGGNNNKQQQYDTLATAATSTPSREPQPASTLHRAAHLLYLLFFKSELLVTTLFLFFATTTLVSSTLTQTQLRMLHFTDQLRQHIRLHLPIVGLVLEHTMQSLSFVPVVVGILFFLFEFFNDQVLAFLLLMLVWLCESYTVLFTRTTTSMLYFPKLFALYFLLFSVYFFSFPYGFHYIAMGLTASQLYTCILYYWFEYEIPAVEAGDISIHRPRMLVLRRADGGEREREDASAGHARGESGDRRRGAGATSTSTLVRGGVSAASRPQDVIARLTSSRDEREVDRGVQTSELPVRRIAPAMQDDGDVNEFEFSRRPLPRISTSSNGVPPSSTVSLGPSSAVTHSESSLPVPASLSLSSSAPGQGYISSSAPSSSLASESASPVPSTSPSPFLHSISASSSLLSSAVDSEAEAAVQRLFSLPQLLHTLLRHTQQLKAQYTVPASPRNSQPHSSNRRTRAASVVSPTLSPLPYKDDSTLPDTQSLALTPPPVSLANEESKEQPTLISPRAAAGLIHDPAALHKVILDQLSNVLQVALYVLTTLVHTPPATSACPSAASISSSSQPAALTAATVFLPLPASNEACGGSGMTVTSLPIPTSPASRSPRSSASSPPPASLPPPRSSPPLSHRASPSLSASGASAPVRRLIFSQRSSSGGSGGAAADSADSEAVPSAASSVAAMGASGEQAVVNAVHTEPVSPDPASDAPMM